jgi:predicted transposase YbfD/YdcC
MASSGIAAILTHFETLTDPRVERTRKHCLLDMIVIALCATIAGADGWADVERFGKAKRAWFARFLELPAGIPSHDTLGRVFARLDTPAFLACLMDWLRSLHLALAGEGIAIDGKTLRRSFDAGSGRAALHLVSAWACDLRISLGQVAVDDKSNEITAVPKLLELLELSGAVVTLDAMHCQKDTAQAIRARGADYVLTVKRNQPGLWNELSDLFIAYGEHDYQAPELRRHTKTERNRGRSERRDCFVAPAPQTLRSRGEWADVQSVGMLYRYCEEQGRTREETTFFISSLPPKVQRLAKLVRGHWSIENSLHWVLDVTFSEDQSRIRQGNAPEIAGVFRRLALSILQQDTSLKSSIRGKRLQAGWNNDALERILSGFQAK